MREYALEQSLEKNLLKPPKKSLLWFQMIFFEEFHGKIPENNSEEIFGAISDGIPAELAWEVL